jgi:hypothetical protein
MSDDEEARPAAPTITAVNVKIPPFWPADPEVWFAQVDAQFSTRGITSQKTKFDHIVASLTPEYATEIRDIILNPPDTNPYDSLKTQLIARTTASEQRRLQQLFNTEELGDRKPSQLLRRMKQLLGEKAATADNAFIRELFLQRLSPNVRMVLASAGSSQTLEELADLADKITEVSAPEVNQVNTQLSSDFQQLRSEISDLKALFKSKQPSFNRRFPSRPPRRSSSPAPHKRPLPPNLCWYHQRFGEDAKKCQPPCTWTGNEQASH